MKDIRQRLLATFQVEHKEHLKCIRDLLSKADGSLAGPDLDEVFRRSHSLKGAARAVDLRDVETLAHHLETLFSKVRSGSIAFDRSIATLVQQALDTSEDLVGALSRNETAERPTTIIEAIEQLIAEPGLPPPQGSPGASALGTPVDHTPFQPLETVRLQARTLDQLINSTGQLSIQNLRQDLLAQKLRDIDRHIGDTLAEQARLRKANSSGFRHIDTTQSLSGVASYVQYLEHETRVLSSEVRSTRQFHERSSWAMRSLTSELQTEVRQARMVPAENVFESFPKMIRDLARDEGKILELQVSGSEVQADRVVLQALKDPLMHVLRNAVSHGAGATRIQLKIEAQGNRLQVAVEDNGRGLDLTRIADVAVRQGLIAQADVAAQSPEALARFVFLPGFSTSRSVTDVSGRGMGLSVVAEAVARLQGKVDIQPIAAGGTRISLSVPLSISSHRLLLVSVLDQTFAIPVHGIERLHRIPLKTVESLEGKPVLRIDGRHIPLVSLAHLLNPAESGVHADRETLNVAVLKLGEQRLAIAVDAFLSERESVIKDLPRVAARNTRLAGGILLEDGSVCLVLNPSEVVSGFQQTGTSLVIKTEGERKIERSARILIVDDSLTTRTLEKSILEAHGYDVSVAVDGVEALDCLRSEPVGLVVTDIEMPRMDGFGLLAEMKNDPRLAQIPVIVVSSVESREHMERGLSLGADAYIVKRRFEQRELLDTIQQIL